MLYIETDLQDARWLVYIMEEFARINEAEFPIRLISKQDKNNSACVINYSTTPSEGICIPNRAYIRPNGKTEKLSNGIYIQEGTKSEDRHYAFRYDLFWNAFVFLSRLEEYLSEVEGQNIHSYSFNHPRQDKSTFEAPVVNHLFDELERIIRKNFPKLSFGQKQKPIIEYSHDIDYIDKTLQLRLKQTGFSLFTAAKNLTRPLFFGKHIKKTAAFLFSSPSYWCFDYWEDLEKKANVRSIFYAYAQTTKKDLKSIIFDPSYKIRMNKRLSQRLRRLLQEGFEIGLHGSFRSATDEERLSKEKTILEESIRTELHKVRQHWLRYFERVTPYIHDKLFKYDSTLGWNDRIGFRSGIANQYRPYDHKNQKPFNYLITPQVIMDANIFEYGVDRIESLSQKAMQLLGDLRELKSAHVSISWHQRVCNSDYRWHGLYENILFHEGH